MKYTVPIFKINKIKPIKYYGNCVYITRFYMNSISFYNKLYNVDLTSLK